MGCNVETLQINRKYNSISITKAKLTRGDMRAKQRRHIIISKWKDKRDVLFLTKPRWMSKYEMEKL